MLREEERKVGTNHPFKHCAVTIASRPTKRCGVLLSPCINLSPLTKFDHLKQALQAEEKMTRKRFQKIYLYDNPVCQSKWKLDTPTPWRIQDI